MTVSESPSKMPDKHFALVDSDVHPHFKDGLTDLITYFSSEWRKRLGLGPNKSWAKQLGVELARPQNVLYMNPAGIIRRDTIPDDGSPPASDPDQVRAQLLDAHEVDRAILLPGDVLGLGILPDPDLAAAVATATNRWTTEVWLSSDNRFRGSIVIAPQAPEDAAAEVYRAAEDSRFVQVFFPTTNLLMGERQYYPIFEAAADCGLPISIHPGAESVFLRGPTLAGGSPTYYIEHHTLIPQVFASNLVSLICQGVFERFQELKLVIVEGGFAWLPGIIWRLDKNWRSVRDDVPWVRRLPSEYVWERVRFTTQPLVEPDSAADLHAMCTMIHGTETLLFSSDYPHWDFDDPVRALGSFDSETRDRIRSTNAELLFGSRL
jgi:predicted TIM-barrel fold metal-dependent hydrolase